MAFSAGLCFACRLETETQTIAVQTESTECFDNELWYLQLSQRRRTIKTKCEMVKVIQNLGDVVEINEMDCDEKLSFVYRGSENEDLIGWMNQESCGRNKLDAWRKKNLKNLVYENKALTPEFKINRLSPFVEKFKCISESAEGSLSETYEELLGSIECEDSVELKKSFLQLIQIEKLTVQKHIHSRRFLSEH